MSNPVLNKGANTTLTLSVQLQILADKIIVKKEKYCTDLLPFTEAKVKCTNLKGIFVQKYNFFSPTVNYIRYPFECSEKNTKRLPLAQDFMPLNTLHIFPNIMRTFS